jgi:hypothetical protein
MNDPNTEWGLDATELLLFGNWFSKIWGRLRTAEHFIEFIRRFGASIGMKTLNTL